MLTLETPVQRQYESYFLRYYTYKAPIGIARGREIIEDLQTGLPDFDVRQYFGTQPTIFVDYEHVVVAFDRANSRALGLLGARWLQAGDRRFLYLWTAMVANAHRRSLLFNRILQYFFVNVSRECGSQIPGIIVTKTYNPIVYCIFKSVAVASPGTQIYPQIPGAQHPEMQKLALAVVAGISPRLILNLETGVVPGGQAAVAPNFFPRMEASADEDVNRHFQQNLTRADQVLCIFATPPSAQHVVRQRLLGTKRERS